MLRRITTQTWHLYERTVPFVKVSLSREGLGSNVGRTLIWGKLRRLVISFFPGWAAKLRSKHGLVGGCTSCGASCNLLFRCPHWDATTHLCTVYELRPTICKTFPITPADIRDRNLVLKDKPCGFKSQKE